MDNTLNTNSNPAEEKKNNALNTQKITSAIIVAGVIIAGAILLQGTYKPIVPTNKDNNEATVTELRPVDQEQDHILGNPNAEVFIIEYSDTECPFCKMFHSTMHNVINESNGRVAWVYRHFPIEQLHKKAFNESLAMECAWAQGGNSTFWQYTDEIYNRTNSNDSLPETELSQIAQDLGLNLNDFNSCLSAQTYSQKIEADIVDGRASGVSGTPFSFILKNGQIVGQIQGASPKEKVLEEIQKALR